MARRLNVLVAALLLAASSAGEAQRKNPAPQRPSVDIADRVYASTYRPLPRTDSLIINAQILDGAGGRTDAGWVLVRDGLIASMGSGAPPAVSGLKIIDAAGRWLTPGIIDIHSHNGTFVAPLTANDNEYSDVSEVSSPIAAGAWVEHGINVQDPSFSRALAGGVTTVHVMPGSIPLIGGRSVVLKTTPANYLQQMKFPGASQGVKMSCGDNPRSYFGSRGRAPNSRMGEIEILREIFGRGDEDRGKGRGPRSDLDAQTIAAILAGELPVHVHCYRADDIATIMNLAEEFGFKIAAVHHATDAYKISSLLAKNGTCAAVWSDWWGFKSEAGDAIRANAAFVDAAGACVAIHSDSPLMGQRLNVEVSKAMAAGRRAGINLPPERAIRWITSNPAKVLGLGDKIGTLARGYNADFVLWSADPFSVFARADLVVVDGAIAFDRLDPQRQPVSDFELGRGRRQ